MARCPECGGRLTPANYLSARRSLVIACRWCRASLSLPSWSRAATLLLTAGLGSAISIYFFWRFLDSGDPSQLAGLMALVALIPVIWALEAVSPLKTLVGRDRRVWQQPEECEE